MLRRAREDLRIVIVAVVAATVAAAVPAIAHDADGGGHDKFAHKTDQVDGQHAVAFTNNTGARARKLVATNAQGRLPGNILGASEAWTEVTFPASASCGGAACWTNYDANHNSAAYYKDEFGVVHLKGLVLCQNDPACLSGDPIFVLPAGYRPAEREVHVTIESTAIGRINVDANGEVLSEGGTNLNQWVTLDGVTFRAAN